MKTNITMALLIFMIFGINAMVMNKTPIENGCGPDGRMYCNQAKSFRMFYDGHRTEYPLHTSQHKYGVHRIVPAGIVHFGLRLMGMPLNDLKNVNWLTIPDKPIIKGFVVMNTILIGIAALLWGLIADILGISQRGKWIGFFGLFINVHLLKLHGFMPVMTDMVAFTLSMSLLYFYLKESYTKMLAVMFLGAFTWPSYLIFSAPLLIFAHLGKKYTSSLGDSSSSSSKLPSILCNGSAGMIGVLALVASWYLTTRLHYSHPDGRAPVTSVLPLSILIMSLYVGFGIKYLLSNMVLKVKDLYGYPTLFRALAFIILFALVEIVARQIAYEGPGWKPPNTPFWIVKAAFVLPVILPFGFGIGHIVSYGPILLFTFFMWPIISRHLGQYGIGLSLFMIAGILISLVCPSRGMIIFVPVLLAFTTKVLDSMSWEKNKIVFFFVLSALFSRVWIEWDVQGGLSSHEIALSFPWQHVLGTWGNWMNNEMYIVNLVVVLLSGILFHFHLRIKRLSPSKD